MGWTRLVEFKSIHTYEFEEKPTRKETIRKTTYEMERHSKNNDVETSWGD